MANSRVISACVVLAVVASGCGSSSSTTTTSTVASAPSINTATNAPTSTPTQSTSTATTQKPSPPPQRTQTKAARKVESKAIERKAKATEKRNRAFFNALAKPLPRPTPTHLPRSRRYPEAVQERFLAACQVGKGSPSRCKCVLAKQELRPVENAIDRRNTDPRRCLDTTLDYVSRHASGKIKPGAVPMPSGVRSSLGSLPRRVSSETQRARG